MTALLLTFICSALFCGLYLWFARRWQILDIPNERSSHQHPTPKGGGLPLMVAFFIATSPMFGASMFWSTQYSVILLGALFLTLLGVADDLWTLSVRLRFLAYGLSSLIVSIALFQGAGVEASLGAAIALLVAAIAILWALNLYNFMDGTDGLAATQCCVACGSAALLTLANGGAVQFSFFCLMLGASHLGFLVWNWPAARLFMGDAGSIPTGFVLAALAVLGELQGELPFACWLVLLAFFITDASWTLIWRIFTGQKFTQAHRSHAYQCLSRHWNSHRAVVFLLLSINVFWLLPLALAVVIWPENTVIIVILAYFPLLVGVAKTRKLT